MNSFAVDTFIEAPPARVWDALADIGEIHRWNPGVIASHTISEADGGLGAARHCDLGGRNYLRETVVAWEPEKRLTMRITDTNLPVQADIRFTLAPAGNGATRVTVSPQYQVKYGLLGRLLDRFYVSKNYEEGMAALLAGLKRYVENRAA